LAAAIGRLIVDPGLRTRLGDAGQARLVSDFGFAPGIAQLTGKFGRVAAACA